jgi:hypothetical protein
MMMILQMCLNLKNDKIQDFETFLKNEQESLESFKSSCSYEILLKVVRAWLG